MWNRIRRGSVYDKIGTMKILRTLAIVALLAAAMQAQPNEQKIYDTERAFQKAVADKGISAAFLEFMAPHAVMFSPGPVNAHDLWRGRAGSTETLTWNPVIIVASSNGLLAYSIGNSIYKAKGVADTTSFPGHYITVWSRRPDGEYRAVLDTGINHEAAAARASWTPGAASTETNEKRISAADSSTGFYSAVPSVGAAKAYKTYLADDAVVLREGKLPFFGKKAAVKYFGDEKPRLRFAKRKSFIESADLAYVYNSYTRLDNSGAEVENGQFIQVWRFRDGLWKIVADVLVPVPPASK